MDYAQQPCGGCERLREALREILTHDVPEAPYPNQEPIVDICNIARKALAQPCQQPAKAGDHECTYDSESEDSRCPKCGLTSGEAIKYFERQQPASVGSDEWHWEEKESGRYEMFCGRSRLAQSLTRGDALTLEKYHNAALRKVREESK